MVIIEIDKQRLAIGNTKIRKEATLFVYDEKSGEYINSGTTIDLDKIEFTDDKGNKYKKPLQLFKLESDANKLTPLDKYLITKDGSIKMIQKAA